MYRAFGLLLPTADYTPEVAQRRLAARFPQYTVLLGDGQVTVESDAWEIELKVNADPQVAADAVRIAERLAGLVDGAAVAACERRVEVWSDRPDPELAHLADFQAVVEVLKSFEGIVVVDPHEPSLL